MKLWLPVTISCSSSRCAPTSDITSSENYKTHAVYTCHICKWYNTINSFFKKSLNSHICVIWLPSYIYSAYIHSWYDVIYEKSKSIHHSPSPHDVSLSSPSIFGKHRLNFRCMTPWRFIQNSNFSCARKQYFLAYFEDFFPQILIMIQVIQIRFI
jgi:hypothetical protein